MKKKIYKKKDTTAVFIFRSYKVERKSNLSDLLIILSLRVFTSSDRDFCVAFQYLDESINFNNFVNFRERQRRSVALFL